MLILFVRYRVFCATVKDEDPPVCEHCKPNVTYLLQDPSSSVATAPAQWQEPGASADVMFAMEDMRIQKAPQPSRYEKCKQKLCSAQAEPGNADSMFAWLSKLLPGL